jgi:hypothetical protein
MRWACGKLAYLGHPVSNGFGNVGREKGHPDDPSDIPRVEARLCCDGSLSHSMRDDIRVFDILPFLSF